MQIAQLSHVKQSTIPPSTTLKRIAWSGGKIVSNKDQALRKFYERKLQQGATLTAAQLHTMQTKLGFDNLEDLASLPSIEDEGMLTPNAVSDKQSYGKHRGKSDPRNHKKPTINPKKKHIIPNHSHAKAQDNTQHIMIINGRVVGPKVSKSHPKGKITRLTNFSKSAFKKKSTSSSPKLALLDQLDMSLDALIKRN